MIRRLKALVPAPLVRLYHLALARLAAVWYGHPSEELIVIGVTGTKGKTTTSYFIAKALEATGAKVGCATTALFKIGEREWINETKMTMLGRFALQRLLRQMVGAGCRYAVVETSSQGLIQYRHEGIHYDIAVLTNLTPEHLEAHGGFDAYKQAKTILFRHLAQSPAKTIDAKPIAQAAILNADCAHADDFARASGQLPIIWYSLRSARGLSLQGPVQQLSWGSQFTVDGVSVTLPVPGEQNIENALAALAVCRALSVPLTVAAQGLATIKHIPGRFERVDVGQPFTVIVDYAHEPESLTRLLETVQGLPHNRIIHIVGSAGGGRDTSRRPILGRLSAEHADVTIVTNEDPYDEDPQTIINQVAAGSIAGGKKEGETLFKILDRREAIDRAMSMAKPGDIVLLTGKGSERVICVADGQKVPWNETEIATESIKSVVTQK